MRLLFLRSSNIVPPSPANEFFPKHELVAPRDKFSANAPDEEWITASNTVGRWVVVSADRRIRETTLNFRDFEIRTMFIFSCSRRL
jgi:hypothetical protein